MLRANQSKLEIPFKEINMEAGWHKLSTAKAQFRAQALYSNMKVNILAMLVGIVGGFGAILFRWLYYSINDISFWHKFSISFISPVSNGLGYWVIIPPAVGGLIIGLITYYYAPETKGHGVPEVMEAMYKKQGIIRPRVVLAKIVASGVCLGTGGSAGREGPIVQIGSAFGSAVSQFLKLSVTDRKILVGCGATAGIAATFNAPLAGIIFSIELILLEFKTESFVPLVISSVFATIISRLFLGSEPIFIIPAYHFQSLYELLFYLAMGILAGFAGIMEFKLLYGIEDIFDKIKVHPALKPAIGGVLLGIIGLEFPQIFGVGYESMGKILSPNYGNPTVYLAIALFALAIAKMFALSITLGSGGSGGVFAPSLFIGAVFGSFFGIIINLLFPSISAPYAAYGLVGMAAMFSATSRATLTSIIMVFEMTRDYEIIIPLIFACVLADITSSIFSKNTIYTEKLARRGIKIPHGLEINIMKNRYVQEIMVKNITTVMNDASIELVRDKILETGHHGFPVLDNNDNLIGLITAEDITNYKNGNTDVCNIDKICKRQLILTYSDETLDEAWKKMSEYDISHLPVVERNNHSKLLGMITKTDMIFHKLA